MSAELTHGTVSGYTLGCRCDECRTAKREGMRAYKRAVARASAELRSLHPDVWSRVFDEAYAEVGIVRQLPGWNKSKRAP